MKCTDNALGGSFGLTVRLPATNAWAIIWPPNVRTGLRAGVPPKNVSGAPRVGGAEVQNRQQLVQV